MKLNAKRERLFREVSASGMKRPNPSSWKANACSTLRQTSIGKRRGTKDCLNTTTAACALRTDPEPATMRMCRSGYHHDLFPTRSATNQFPDAWIDAGENFEGTEIFSPNIHQPAAQLDVIAGELLALESKPEGLSINRQPNRQMSALPIPGSAEAIRI